MARIKWNMKAFEEIRRLPGVKNALKKEADSIRDAAGDGYVSDVAEGRTRSRASVITGDAKSAVDNSKNNSLLKSLHSRGK